MPSAPISFPAGYYGKLPARGDFLARGLPPQLIAPWDAWLQSALSSSRKRLGADWLDCYLSAPLWRFVLPSGLIMSQAVAGVLCPSVDRTGRHFPFTIAAVLGSEQLDPIATVVRAAGWFAAVEQAALAGLAPGLDVDLYGRRVDALGFPQQCACIAADKGELSPLNEDLHVHLQLQGGSWSEETLGSIRKGEAASEPFALWLTQGSEVIPDCALATGGLPSSDRFAAMLDGQWTRHGWRECAGARAYPVRQPDA